MKRGLLIVFLLTWIAHIGNSQTSKTQVGATYYDLQTNNSIERRIVIDPISKKRTIVYTGSSSNDGLNGAYNDRGTGYYYYSGVGAMTPKTIFPGRLETKRVGWPQPLYLSGGKEIVISHQAGTTNGLNSVKSNVAGSGAWVDVKVSSGAQTWPRAGNNGDSIFVISSFSTQSGGTGSMFGMLGGIGFKRSYNGGASWTPDSNSMEMDSIPGLNEKKYPNVPNTSGQTGNVIGGDQYALDVKGKTVAVLTGGLDVTLYLSTDFGNTWTMTTIVEGDNNSGDTLPSDLRSGGDFSVLIDNNNNVHCFWGLLYGNNFTNTIAKAGIVYWNNVTKGMKPKVIYKTSYGLESDPKAELYIPFFTQVVSTFNTGPSVPNQIFYGSGYTCNPSAGIDANNVIYLSYQRTRGVNDTTRLTSKKIIDGNGNLMSDCYVVKSIDGGASWIGPYNVSNSDTTEDAYASIARFVDDSVHIVYQQDSFAGAIVNNTNSRANFNKIIYARVAVNSITNPKDITPPILLKKDNILASSNGVITQVSFPDTFKILSDCNIEETFQDSFKDVKTFLMKHVIQAFDDNDSVVILIDTPANFSRTVPGKYYINVRVKDTSNNFSTFIGTTTSVFSWDTLKFILLVDPSDNTPPVISMTKKVDYTKLGDPYTLPTPICVVTDNNKCGQPSVTTPTVSQVDVNKVGLYNLVVTATDIKNNKSTDTLKVNVGDAPSSSFSNEAITNNKVISAKGTTPEISPLYPNLSYSWKTKIKNGGYLENLSTSKDLSYNINTNTKEFDSLCLEVKNTFNDNVPTVKVKPYCRYLKYTKGGTGPVGIQSAVDNNIKFEIAPNPNSGSFKLQYEGISKLTEASINIQDINGRVIFEQKATIKGSGEIPVRLTNITNGEYFINAQIGENHFLRKLEINK